MREGDGGERWRGEGVGWGEMERGGRVNMKRTTVQQRTTHPRQRLASFDYKSQHKTGGVLTPSSSSAVCDANNN